MIELPDFPKSLCQLCGKQDYLVNPCLNCYLMIAKKHGLHPLNVGIDLYKKELFKKFLLQYYG